MKNFKIERGDVLAVLTQQPDNCFDAAFCDPPYGLAFMGKAWDHGVPGADVWREVLRVLKPGAPLMAFGGTRTYHRLACAIEDAGFAISDTLCWLHGQGFPKGHAQLKPAWEPITLAWKKGARALNIDGARIGTEDLSAQWSRTWNQDGTFGNGKRASTGKISIGRWPANVLLDPDSAAMLDVQSGVLTSGDNPSKRSSDKHKHVYAGFKGEQTITPLRLANSGGASRFFYCAKSSKRERGEDNTHPTVKPLKLTEYLARLILPPANGTPRRILIPYSGSGSEMISARNAGFEFALGIEIDREYAAIAKRRVLKAAA